MKKVNLKSLHGHQLQGVRKTDSSHLNISKLLSY